MRRIKQLLVFGILTSVSVSSYALCDYHNMPNFGSYGRHFNPDFSQHNFSISTLTVRHPARVDTKVKQLTVIDINYQVPSIYRDIEIQVLPDEKVTLEGKNTFSLNDLKGSLQLPVKVTATGEYKLIVMIQGMKRGMPYSRVQEIKLSSV